VFLRRRWLEPPTGLLTVDWTNPLAQGLVFAQAGPSPVDIVGEKSPTQFYVPPVVRRSYGFAWSFPLDAAFSIEWQSPIYDGPTSMFCMTELMGSNIGQGAILGIYRTYTTGDNCFRQLLKDGSGIGSAVDGFTTGVVSAASWSQSFNTKISVGVETAGAFQNTFFNGVPSGFPNKTSNPDVSEINRVAIGAQKEANGSNTRPFEGYISTPMIWNRKVTHAEFADLHKNPWQVFKKATRLIVSLPSTAWSYSRPRVDVAGGSGWSVYP
jgi:hypothetical protein